MPKEKGTCVSICLKKPKKDADARGNRLSMCPKRRGQVNQSERDLRDEAQARKSGRVSKTVNGYKKSKLAL